MSDAYYKMPFGKFKGVELDEIWDEDPGYLEWVEDNLENDDVREKVSEFLTERRDRDKRWGRR